MADERDQIRDFATHVAPMVTAPVVFDVGTNRGQILDKMLVELPGAVFHAFEPNVELGKELRAKYAARRNVHVVTKGVGSANGTMRLNIYRYDETCSFLPLTSHFRGLKWAAPMGQVEVPVVTLDSYCQELKIPEVHLVKLDTQGFELEVLKGAERSLSEVWAVYSEVQFSPIYEGQAEFWQLDRFMREHDFRLYNFYHLGTHAETGQLGAGDAMWVNNRKKPYYRPRQPWEAQLERDLGVG
jgi:FkbM family methyltransferase